MASSCYSFRICSSLMAAVDRLKLSARLRALDSSVLGAKGAKKVRYNLIASHFEVNSP